MNFTKPQYRSKHFALLGMASVINIERTPKVVCNWTSDWLKIFLSVRSYLALKVEKSTFFHNFSVINHYKLYVKIKGWKIKYKVRLTYSENMGNPYFRFNNTDQLKNCLHLGLFMHVYIMMSYYGKYLILDIFWGGALTVHRDSLVQFTVSLWYVTSV